MRRIGKVTRLLLLHGVPQAAPPPRDLVQLRQDPDFTLGSVEEKH
jgi:hypothetical protein